MGRWIEAAWDYRLADNPDADYYRFPGAAGARVRLSLRHPDSQAIILEQLFAKEGFVLNPQPGAEGAGEYTLKAADDPIFAIRPRDFPAGRYTFRIDPIP